MHILTTASLGYLASLGHLKAIDSRRLRPMVVIEVVNAKGFVENQWSGRRLGLGSLT
jgi:hypothetical protein